MAYPTNPIYKLVKNSDGVINAAKKQTGNQIIVFPFSEGNADYQEYLKWCNGEDPYTEKGTAEAAD